MIIEINDEKIEREVAFFNRHTSEYINSNLNDIRDLLEASKDAFNVGVNKTTFTVDIDQLAVLIGMCNVGVYVIREITSEF